MLHERSSQQPCDLWTSLCHPMPGLMQKGLGRQRDAQLSRNHLTVLIYGAHGANLPFFDPGWIYTDFRVDFGGYFVSGWVLFFFPPPFSCEPAEANLACHRFKRSISQKAQTVNDTISIGAVCCCNLEDLCLVIGSARCRALCGPAECCCSLTDARCGCSSQCSCSAFPSSKGSVLTRHSHPRRKPHD